MRARPHRSSSLLGALLALTLVLGAPRRGSCREPTSASRDPGSAPESAPAPSGSVSAHHERLGWVILGSSLAGAGTLLSLGLSVDCVDNDTRCQRRTSLAIMGSLGLASLGSIIGLTLLQKARGTSAASARSAALRLELGPARAYAERPFALRLELEPVAAPEERFALAGALLRVRGVVP